MGVIVEIVNRFYLKFSRRAKRWLFRIIDTVLLVVSLYLAFSLRFDLFEAWTRLPLYQEQIYLVLPIKLIFFSLVGVYRPVLRYAGLEFLGTVFVASIGSSGLLFLTRMLFEMTPLPRSILIMDSILTLILLVSVRIIIRYMLYYAVTQAESENKQERIIVYGAGEAGNQLVRALVGETDYKVVAFVDENSQLHGQVISGINVHSQKRLGSLIKKHHVDSVLLALPSMGKQKNREIVKSIQHLPAKIKIIPRMGDIITGKVSINEIRNIDITNLLGREEVKPHLDLLEKNIQDKVVLVTGAGGSIGSELCRQIIEHRPKILILYELNEFALYNIDLELNEKELDMGIVPCLGTVLNQYRLEELFSKYSVQTVYHAAAYKHVPIVELNISEGVMNNVEGTLSCVLAAVNCDVESFLLISTDKAVRPTNVMGTTKRIAEMILQAFNDKPGVTTRFVIVRFGNVLDSNGSVVPLFRKQLTEGQNLTLTHGEITRYFMSIPEAARLVIQSGAIGEGGEVFLLDMGEPIRIYDLAAQMIKLSGLKLGKDINIDVTGLRPGEKLFEELLIDQSKSESTVHPKIFCANEKYLPWEELQPKLDSLIKAVENGNQEEIIQKLKKIVPEYKNKNCSAN
jgi:FlaA1/EpsC-like NDP-sugar epimerase